MTLSTRYGLHYDELYLLASVQLLRDYPILLQDARLRRQFARRRASSPPPATRP